MTARRARPISVLVIAGSDSGGGAGVQADLRTLAAHGVHGACAITALTAQNTREVASIDPVRPRVLTAQIDAAFADFAIGAVKIGMLATPGLVRAAAAALARRPRAKIVLDPVLVATTGASLAKAGLVAATRRHLLARALLVTPNVPEAGALLGRAVAGERDVPSAAAELIALGARNVLLKGGHFEGRRVGDFLATADGTTHWFRHRRIAVHGHGTGCTLSSAIAARLALGDSLEEAAGEAVAYVHRALERAYRPGRGRLAVLDHFGAAKRR